ncbi:hypothetical protein BBW65_06790 [Helicobacter enhydrae]|uniref:Uncharacterized protein n=1 Tax=Helicobacter enhydrae TaxID=222136 RepID=A0A1B1U6T9_9HELI|nr:hypothetical protein [Helicobacter enhydrae]ANV98517.1 hypothetical protein BBW65_06790 [Helicobacter enhydrae]
MKIEFKKITSTPKSFHFQSDGMSLEGEIWRDSSKLYKIKAKLNGNIVLTCDRSGEEYEQQIEEVLSLCISNGIWDTQSQNQNDDFDVIEFFDGFVDFEYILQSEMDLIQMQYHTQGE